MDIRNAKIVLKKINALIDSMDYEGSTLSSIEKDLMLSYIRQLYENVLSDQNSTTAPFSPPRPKQADLPTPVQPERPTPKEEPKPEYKPAPKEEPKPEPRQEQQTAPEPEYKPAPKPKPQPEVKAAPKPEYKPDPVPVPEPQPVIKKRLIEEEPIVKPKATPPPAAPKGISGLFTFREATELSEKLSESPVKDLNGAMSINDRLLYMNELFGRDMKELEAAIKQLNSYRNMDEAKNYLFTIAEQYNWANEEKEDIARSFIKLIRRRYL